MNKEKYAKRVISHWNIADYGRAQTIYAPRVDRFVKAYFGHNISDDLVRKIDTTLNGLVNEIYNDR